MKPTRLDAVEFGPRFDTAETFTYLPYAGPSSRSPSRKMLAAQPRAVPLRSELAGLVED